MAELVLAGLIGVLVGVAAAVATLATSEFIDEIIWREENDGDVEEGVGGGDGEDGAHGVARG